MKVIFFGLGSIGNRHLDIVRKKGYDLYAFPYSANKSLPTDVQRVMEWDDVDKIKPDVAFICNPTRLHIRTAIKCAEKGINLFIEKPLGLNEVGLDELVRLVKEKRLVAYVAYPFRHHPDLQIKPASDIGIVCHTNFKDWKTYAGETVDRSNDGVLLELSHEIDLAEHLLGKLEGIRLERHTYTQAELITDHDWGKRKAYINLDLESDEEIRQIALPEKDIDYISTDEMYQRQIDWYFYNLNSLKVMGVVWRDQVGLFRKILDAK